MHLSVKKYLKFPVVKQQSLKPLQSMEHPHIYVCMEDQFNVSKARVMGYKHFGYFLVGQLEGSGEFYI